MSSRELPAHPNLEQYKKQAKDLLKSWRAGDPGALDRVNQHHPRFLKPARRGAPRRTFGLADAQWVIAREHGFESWPKFTEHLRGVVGDAGGENASTVVATQLEITTAEINLCVFARDGKRAFTSAEGNPVQVWDVETRRCLRRFDEGGVNVWGLTATADGRLVVIGGRDGIVRLMDVETGQLLHELRGHRSLIRCVALSSDAGVALSGEMRDPRMRLWDVEVERCVQFFEGHTDGLYDVALDRTQQRALSGSRDTTVRLWDLASGRCLRVLEGHTYHVHSVVWSGDGRRALSSSQDIRLWDLGTGRCLRVFRGHTQVIRSVAWSADERRAVSASHDGTVRVWDVESGECLRVLEGHPVGVLKAVWSANGSRVYSCDWKGGIRQWPSSSF
jgi:WD40 repeat protein